MAIQANGKVDPSQRTDEDEFYRRVIFRTPGSSPRSAANGSTNTAIADSTSPFEAGPWASACASFGSHLNLFNNWLETAQTSAPPRALGKYNVYNSSEPNRTAFHHDERVS
jgi:hypothetical protein